MPKRKFVSFGMFWQVYGRQEIELPDDVDASDIEAVKDYIRNVWPTIPLPEGSYVQDSDEFDEDGIIDVHTEY